MHLLHAGVPLEIIALWLGHEQPNTTHTYVQADLNIKDQCAHLLDRTVVPARPAGPPLLPPAVISRSSATA